MTFMSNTISRALILVALWFRYSKFWRYPFVFVVLIVLGAPSWRALAEQDDLAWPAVPGEKQAERRGLVVIAGDSRSDPYGGGGISFPGTWPYLLAQIDPFVGAAQKYNLARKGYRTIEVLKQLNDGVFARPLDDRVAVSPPYFLLWVGLNDMLDGYPASATYQNLRDIWAGARGL